MKKYTKDLLLLQNSVSIIAKLFMIISMLWAEYLGQTFLNVFMLLFYAVSYLAFFVTLVMPIVILIKIFMVKNIKVGKKLVTFIISLISTGLVLSNALYFEKVHFSYEILQLIQFSTLVVLILLQFVIIKMKPFKKIK